MHQQNSVMTIAEVAHDLRCSKAHVYNLLNGLVGGVAPLPYIGIGRTRRVLRVTLESWKTANERTASTNATIRSSPDVDTAGA